MAGHSLLLLPNTESKTEHCGNFTNDILLVKVGPILPCGIVLKRASPDGVGEDAEYMRLLTAASQLRHWWGGRKTH